MAEKTRKKEDQKLKVLNSLLVKKVVDDGDGIAVVGTMIQRVFVEKRKNNNATCDIDDATSTREILCCKKTHPEKKHKGIAFDYRFNDFSAANGDHISFRRSEIHETDNEMCFRHTYQVKIPLEIDMSFDSVPFKVVCASSMIELSTFVLDENKEDEDNKDGIKIRPNLTEHKTNEDFFSKLTIYFKHLEPDKVNGKKTNEDNEDGIKIRPNLTVHKEHKTNMVCIQRDFVKQKSINYDIVSNFISWFCTSFGKYSRNKDKEKMQKVKEAMEKIDRSRKYDFVSPFPHVQYFYDTKKEYCPKFMISFLLIEDGMKKFVEVFLPLLLIGLLNTINVVSDREHLIENNEVEDTDARYLKATSNGEPVSATDYLANSATLTLAVILLLPYVMSTSFIQSFWTTNNLFIIIILIALGLSSIPYQLAQTRAYAYAGMGLYWASYLFPLLNLFQYYRFFQHRREEHDENTNHPHYYMEESKDQQFKLKGNKSIRDDLMTVEEACKLSESKLDNEVDAVKLIEKSSDSKSENLMGYQCRYMNKKVCRTRKKGKVRDNRLCINETSTNEEERTVQSDKHSDENDTALFMVLEYIYEEDSKKKKCSEVK